MNTKLIAGVAAGVLVVGSVAVAQSNSSGGAMPQSSTSGQMSNSAGSQGAMSNQTTRPAGSTGTTDMQNRSGSMSTNSSYGSGAQTSGAQSSGAPYSANGSTMNQGGSASQWAGERG